MTGQRWEHRICSGAGTHDVDASSLEDGVGTEAQPKRTERKIGRKVEGVVGKCFKLCCGGEQRRQCRLERRCRKEGSSSVQRRRRLTHIFMLMG